MSLVMTIFQMKNIWEHSGVPNCYIVKRGLTLRSSASSIFHRRVDTI